MHGGAKAVLAGPFWRKLRWGFCVCLLLLPTTTIAAQVSSQSGVAQQRLAAQQPLLRQEFDDLYRRVLSDPSNIALNERLLLFAVELKDYDAAIGAVERLIFYKPDDATLLLQAARLYFTIESYAAARGYLEDAIAMPSASPELRQQAMELLGQVEQATRPSPWAFFGQGGVRYQTDANLGPPFLSANEIYFIEGPVPDWNVFGLGALSYANPVNNNLIAEASVAAYYSDQFKVDRLDLGFGEATGGPRFVTSDGMLSLKPYGLVQGFQLGSDPYEFVYGGGATGRWTISEGWWFEPVFEYKNRRYFNSDDYQLATDQTGELFAYLVNGAGQFSENFSWRSNAAFNQNDAAKSYQSYDQYFGSLAVRMGFDVFDWQGWALTPFASASFTDYKGLAPTEANNPPLDTIRADFQWNAGATLEVPVTENLGVSFQVQYTDNKSTLSCYSYDNLQVTSGPTLRF